MKRNLDSVLNVILLIAGLVMIGGLIYMGFWYGKQFQNIGTTLKKGQSPPVVPAQVSPAAGGDNSEVEKDKTGAEQNNGK